MLVLNTWYVAAWSTEVTGKPVRRTICEQPIVLYRTRAGKAVALAWSWTGDAEPADLWAGFPIPTG